MVRLLDNEYMISVNETKNIFDTKRLSKNKNKGLSEWLDLYNLFNIDQYPLMTYN